MAELQVFWWEVVHVWENGLLGVDVGSIINALFILFVALVLRQLFTKFVLGWLKRMTAGTRSRIDDKLIGTLEPPVRFIPIVIGVFLALHVLNLEGDLYQLSANINHSLISYTIFWALYCASELLTGVLHRLKKIFTPELIEWIIRAFKVLIVVIGAAAILEIWGIQVGPIIAGFGLIGVAVALGAQDLFKNLISGILILGEKRFRKNDWIRVDGVVEGTVESIGFRSTMIRRFDKAPVMVPNAQLSDTAVTNFSKMTFRRIYWKIGVEYRTNVDQLRTIRDQIETYILEHTDFASPHEASTFVRIDAFGPSSIDIMVYCFTRTRVWGEYLEVKEALAYAIMEIVEGAGAGFAFPSTSVYVESLPGVLSDDKPEPFVAPKVEPKVDPLKETRIPDTEAGE